MNQVAVFIMVCSLMFGSCVQHRQIISLNEGPEFSDNPEAILNYHQIRIQPDDILYITVRNSDAEGITTQPYNPIQLPGMSGGGGGNIAQLQGYLVDEKGYIQFPGIGSLRVVGLTTEQLRQQLTDDLSSVIKSPIVNVRFMNFRLTVMGEVRSPGIVEVQGERINILEALAQAGDLTPLSNRENIRIYREQDGMREVISVNLHDRSIVNSPYFYLRQNDIIYVEPEKAAIYSMPTATRTILPWIGLGTTLLNLIILVSRK